MGGMGDLRMIVYVGNDNTIIRFFDKAWNVKPKTTRETITEVIRFYVSHRDKGDVKR